MKSSPCQLWLRKIPGSLRPRGLPSGPGTAWLLTLAFVLPLGAEPGLVGLGLVVVEELVHVVGCLDHAL